MKLSYADRDTYYADPDFVDVPARGLLSDAYAKTRANEIDPQQASVAFKAGDPLPHDPDVHEWPFWVADIEDSRGAEPTPGSFVPSSGGLKDTSHIAIIDGDGKPWGILSLRDVLNIVATGGRNEAERERNATPLV